MAYNKGRLTISKFDCLCNSCGKNIKKSEEVFIVPGKKVICKNCRSHDIRKGQPAPVSRGVSNSLS